MIEVPESYRLTVERDVTINATPEDVWEVMLDQIGPGMDRPDGIAMPLTLEAWPGGRYFRDLGNNAGHFWGHVQVIKPPTLLEIVGPMFMSAPVLSHVQYRVKAEGSSTRLTITHNLLGELPADLAPNMTKGWEWIINRIKTRCSR